MSVSAILTVLSTYTLILVLDTTEILPALTFFCTKNKQMLNKDKISMAVAFV